MVNALFDLGNDGVIGRIDICKQLIERFVDEYHHHAGKTGGKADNISFMKDFRPLDEKELEAVGKVQEIFRNMNLIPCTACRYCEAGCPKQIKIPDLFAVMNTKQLYHDWNADYYYNNVHTSPEHKASDCIKCSKCEKACPQHLKIRELLEDVAKEFEKG